MHKQYTTLTHVHSDQDSYGIATLIHKAKAMYTVAIRRSGSIRTISTAVKAFVKEGSKLLRCGVETPTPGMSQVDALKNPGSIKDIKAEFSGSSKHIDEQIRKLGRTTVYQMCRYLRDIQIPLEKCYEAIVDWEEMELKKYSKWRDTVVDGLNADNLCEAHNYLEHIVRHQLTLLELLNKGFSIMTESETGKERMEKLFILVTDAQGTVEELMDLKQLEVYQARQEVGENALVRAVGRGLPWHESANVPLIGPDKSMIAFESCKVVMEFVNKIHVLLLC